MFRVQVLMPYTYVSIFGIDGFNAAVDMPTLNAASAKKIWYHTPFPLTLPERLINLYTFKGDTVLDPFMGSGTTAVACVQAERNYIGFEINKEFCDKAEERIKNETN